MPGQQAQRFDMFMCHNSEDKPAVIALAEKLRQQDIRPWLDLWELRPGLDWQDALETQIEQIATAAVFVGSNGMGPWQMQEVKAFLREFVDRGCPVIPVLLPDAPDAPELPTFLKGKTWVDFRQEVPEPFGMLKWGITGERPEELGGQVAAVAAVGPVVTERAIATATNFEDQYLACQASDVQALRSEGTVQHSGIFVPLLRDVFVPLNLDLSANTPGFRALFEEISDGLELSRSFSIWDFLEKAKTEKTFRQLAILAWGGYGKTTLLKHVAYRLGTKQAQKAVPQEVPFLLVLRKYRELLTGEDAPSLPELIAGQHVKGLAGAEDLVVPDGWVKEVLRSGRALVMFDGFDEVARAQRPAVARWLNEQMRQYGESTFIVTSRPKAYREQDAANRLVLASSLWVQDFDQRQRADFVQRWYGCQERYVNAGRETPDVKKRAAESSQDLLEQIEQQAELRALAKNPLLLNMIVTFHRRYMGANLPKRRVELY